MHDEAIGQRIREQRKEVGASVSDMAEALGLSKATLHRYENGDIKTIKLLVLDRIAQYLDVNTPWLLGKTTIKTSHIGTAPHRLEGMVEYIIRAVEQGNVVSKSGPLDESTKKAVIAMMQAVKSMAE